MSWNYRVIKHKGAPDGKNDWYAIHEVYYGKDHNVMWTINEIAPIGNNCLELSKTLELMKISLTKPVLVLDESGELEGEE